ncbi:hypothetical protein [Halalkalibacterium halodurans]|uniref:hypothetical protein n=1 Tax=Halalkalibacterium halodurans TaxID=86665 RepID=UPI0006A9A865|nr:hypothetical protein [Halalkalibacterium halodurans]TPE67961.1 hypothetical protein AMD02_015895 [Halalkalibacterium halodurans]
MTQPREPGSGAIAFAAKYVRDLDFEQALITLGRLMDGQLHDPRDKRVKRCDYCGYFWRDETRNNRKQTCSAECRRGIKTLHQAARRAKQKARNSGGRKPTKKGEYYRREHGLWTTEGEMLKHVSKHERPYPTHKVAQIDAAKGRDRLTGGRRKPNYYVPYSGDEKDGGHAYNHRVNLRIPETDREPSELKTGKIDDVDAYLRMRYSAETLKRERKRASQLSRKLGLCPL